MVGRVFKSIRGAFEQISGFLLLLFRMPTVRSEPKPSKSAAKRVREAMHVSRAGTAFTGTSRTDKLLGKELAEGHKTTVYGDPMSKRPLVTYGGRAPVYRRKPSLLVTVLLAVCAASIFLGILRPDFWFFW